MNNNFLKKINLLRKFDTPTICNGLELIDQNYKTKNYSTENFFCLSPKLKPMVGFAKTAKISSLKNKNITQPNIREDYYSYINQGNFPKISVIKDICKNPIGSFWGEVNANIHYKLGCLGVLTNGSVRDVDVIPKNFQFLAKKLSPSHAEVSIVNFSKKINFMGLKISDNDLIHADLHGAVIIKIEYVNELFNAIKFVTKKEKIILDSCKDSKFNFNKFKQLYSKAKNLKYK